MTPTYHQGMNTVNRINTASPVPCDPSPQGALSAAIDEQTRLLGYSSHLLDRVTEIADRILGSEPKDASNNCKAPSPSGEIYRLIDVQTTNYATLREIDTQLERFKRL